jgi:hypothetical protein
VVAETVRLAVPVEILKRGHAGKFQGGTYPFGDAVLSLHSVGNCERVMPVGGVVQQTDTCKRCKPPAYLFLPGIPAAKDIP